ncbi:hypothetical protein PX701_13895 [Agromyces sp. H3Y2-19a]|uniref:hypothetical protein n=1 Tax=Agromyces chromiiresistens TaxID=3030835 RepID=UPI0023B9CE34|nr:hypothetical protein [Agromyces chromiiresistens]MDF0514719.1 hypothetical protein [Agromyces chromiiresistens]
MENRPSKVVPFDFALSAAIRGVVAERQFTQSYIGKRSNTTTRTLIRYLNGQSPIPVAKLMDIGEAIGVRAEDLIARARVIMAQREAD